MGLIHRNYVLEDPTLGVHERYGFAPASFRSLVVALRINVQYQGINRKLHFRVVVARRIVRQREVQGVEGVLERV